MSRDEQGGRRTRRLAIVVAALLVLGGASALTVGLASQVRPPQPPASTGPTVALTSPAAPTPSAAPPSAGPSTPVLPPGAVPPLPPARPTHVEIPAIGVSSDLLQLGRNADGTVQVPPLAKDSEAGWYRYSPTPGELGPSVLLGHVDSAAYGPGVFFELGALHAGDTVAVTRADHTVATFRVTHVASYPKHDFPTLAVYGNTDDAELRLITCGGAFDSSARSYLNNIVVYAVLAGSTPG